MAKSKFWHNSTKLRKFSPHFFSGMCIINIRSFEIFRSLAFSHSRSLIFFWLLGSNIDISCDKYLRHTSSEFIRLSNNFKRKYNSTLHKSCRFLLVSFCATHTHTYTQAHMQARTVFVGHARENILLHIRAHMERSNDIIHTKRKKNHRPAPTAIVAAAAERERVKKTKHK